MNKTIFIYSLFFVIILFGCQNPSKQNNSIKVSTESQEKTGKQEFIIKAPKFTDRSSSNELKQVSQQIINKIDQSISKLNKAEKKITLFNTPNTPVKIWYSNNQQPVKIECGVTDDGGQFTGTISFYFIDGRLWYADQIFAKYLFDSDNLQFWLDEHWNINKIPKIDFKNREQQLKKEIEQLLVKTN